MSKASPLSFSSSSTEPWAPKIKAKLLWGVAELKADVDHDGLLKPNEKKGLDWRNLFHQSIKIDGRFFIRPLLEAAQEEIRKCDN